MTAEPRLRHTFPKTEHLCLQRDIEALFSAGSRSLSVFPVRAVFRSVAADSGPRVKVLVSVSKRKLKHAVDRNRAKRQLREAYRLRKHMLADALPEGTGMHVGLLWMAATPQPSATVARAVGRLLHALTERVAPTQTPGQCP